jgi:hypothetical protein
MIPIKKESKELYKQFHVYENCIFCNKETDTWHLPTNQPVCSNCAKNYKVSDIESFKIRESKSPFSMWF